MNSQLQIFALQIPFLLKLKYSYCVIDTSASKNITKRLHAIATMTSDTTLNAGICGFCLLQTYQIIAELQEYYLEFPPSI
ncbi:hypothetical protein H710_00064 [Bartonella bacilliformis Ver097]|uniref:Uncharacterized protein n=2 Tax=Bartonella bacilliformis TaxID=774 RepID=A0A072R7E7_BARBA|nr:hypothetical protein H710_00064 [Bartonella bacilliformis Ver097]